MATLAEQFAQAVHLQQAGQLPQAEQAYRQILQTHPNQAEVHNNLGGVLIDQGRLVEAFACYHAALQLSPSFAAAHNGLGFALERSNQLDQAIRCYEQALRLKPGFAQAWYNLGNVLGKQNKLVDAVGAYQQALRLMPENADALKNLGNALAAQHQWSDAERCHLEAVRLRPGDAAAQYNLGLVQERQGKHEQAITSYRQALQDDPHNVDVHLNLGNALVNVGQLAEAETEYRTVLQLSPNNADGHWNLAHLCLRLGRFEEGWSEYEWRSARPGFAKRAYAQPIWNGSDLGGQTLLVYCDQGLGDTMQFIRYIPLVKQRGGKVIVQCQASLLRLLASVSGIDQLVADTVLLPAFDVHISLQSLPLIFGTKIDTIPADVPYLFADKDLQEHWHSKLGPLEKFKIGIAWQGNPAFLDDQARSIPLTCFAPLAKIEGVQLVSLQKGPGMEQLHAAANQFDVLDLGHQFDEASGAFMDTAAVMKNLDLVICSDSAVAHLAGALGVPVWVALAKVPEWRWLLEREDIPWYPGMRLFRQRFAGDWADVFGRIAGEMKAQLLDGKA
ncbi:MAG TPA: tetratricopeptide repeat protein [Gemmataceae bacterium]|nr:tetratricopeptide repeat protein [Gemmataceae bacterium]